ncbi:MAG: AAA family ATPase [Microthrixaceae bacterium]
MSLLDAHPILLITGISASGKSTVAELLAQRFDRGVHVKGDIFRRMVVAGRHEMTAAPTEEAWRQLRLRYRLGAQTANAYHEAGFSVVVQDVVVGQVLTEYVAQLHGRPLVAVVLTPRSDVVAEREAQRSKVAYRASFDGVEALDRSLRNETPRLGMWLDSSDLTPSETVDAIIEDGLDQGEIS